MGAAPGAACALVFASVVDTDAAALTAGGAGSGVGAGAAAGAAAGVLGGVGAGSLAGGGSAGLGGSCARASPAKKSDAAKIAARGWTLGFGEVRLNTWLCTP